MDNVEIPSSVRSAPGLDRRGVRVESGKLNPDDSAVYAMTDFRRENPISVPPSRSIEEALRDMNRLGIHALPVVTEPQGADSHQQMLGLITAYRIERYRMAERRVPQHLRGCSDVCVGEIMTPWNELALVNYRSLPYLSVSEVYQMFQGSGLTHVVVVETQDDDSLAARGMISRAAIAKRLQELDGADAD